MENTAKIITELQNKCTLQEQQIAELKAKLNWFEEQFRLNQKRRFTSTSEHTDQQQLQLFNEAEAEAKPSLPEPTMEEITCHRKKRGQRAAQLKDLPVETIEYRLPPEEQVCSCCGHELHEMSTEIRQELKIIPAQVKVVKHVRYIYACRRCEREAINTPIVTAPMPAPVLPRSLASPSAMAYVITQKYLEAMPLCRQEKAWARLGLEISRQTLADWIIQGADRFLHLLYAKMYEHLLKQDILHADDYRNIYIIETGLQITL